MNRPLRFCMITTFYPPYFFGGDGMFVYRLSNELASRGHRVHVIHCLDSYYALQPAQPLQQYPNHSNVTVHGLKSRAGVLSPVLTHQTGHPFFKGEKIRRIIENGMFDVIHFHNISLVGGPKALEYGNAIKLYTMHEYWLVCPTHVLFKLNRQACVKPICFICSAAYKRPPQLWRYTGMLEEGLKNIDAFISPSRFAADMHARMGLRIPTVHIPLFVPRPPELAGEPEALKKYLNLERPYFLFVGRLEKIKGLQDLIPVFREYKHADLLVVGTGAYEKRLRESAGANTRIKFLGALPYEQLAALYSQAVALIVPSICYETFGQVIVEAFSMRTPVIAKDTGALREMIADSGGGLLYQRDTELLNAMEMLRTETGLRNAYGERAYAAYLRYWTEEHYLASYFELIDSIEEMKRRPPAPARDRAAV